MSEPRDDTSSSTGSDELPAFHGETNSGALSDEELDGLSSRPAEGMPPAAGGANAEHAQRSWIVKNSEQEAPDSQGP